VGVLVWVTLLEQRSRRSPDNLDTRVGRDLQPFVMGVSVNDRPAPWRDPSALCLNRVPSCHDRLTVSSREGPTCGFTGNSGGR
ncbi:MAG: hypothetical protein ABGY41_14990, partial [Candidatus Poribacteria bacterium]